mgnify:CR=1 FL=1
MWVEVEADGRGGGVGAAYLGEDGGGGVASEEGGEEGGEEGVRFEVGGGGEGDVIVALEGRVKCG